MRTKVLLPHHLILVILVKPFGFIAPKQLGDNCIVNGYLRPINRQLMP